jgi:hypothetical protein
MDDDMFGLTAPDEVLMSRLAAYAEARLSPDLATTSRLRAKVLAVAHREATLRRADAGLAVVSTTAVAPHGPRSGATAPTSRDRRSRSIRRTAAALVVASLTLGLVAGSVFAAQAGGPLYGARLWAEELAIPSDPSARALAEIARLDRRLDEARAAGRAGDVAAVAAALAAYESILEAAAARAIGAGDDVAIAALEAGVTRNIAVLRTLADVLPGRSSVAIDAAIERAITRSGTAIDHIEGGAGGAGGAGSGSGGPPAVAPGSSTKPGPKPDRSLKPAATERAGNSAKPDRTPPSGGRPSGPPAGAGGQGSGGGPGGG